MAYPVQNLKKEIFTHFYTKFNFVENSHVSLKVTTLIEAIKESFGAIYLSLELSALTSYNFHLVRGEKDYLLSLSFRRVGNREVDVSCKRCLSCSDAIEEFSDVHDQPGFQRKLEHYPLLKESEDAVSQSVVQPALCPDIPRQLSFGNVQVILSNEALKGVRGERIGEDHLVHLDIVKNCLKRRKAKLSKPIAHGEREEELDWYFKVGTPETGFRILNIFLKKFKTERDGDPCIVVYTCYYISHFQFKQRCHFTDAQLKHWLEESSNIS
jgi:hypothetical protein